MNERMQELAKQAGCSILYDYDMDGHAMVLSVKDMEKFAELIVQECVKVVDDMADPEDSERYFWAIQNASEQIKEHFGVKQ